MRAALLSPHRFILDVHLGRLARQLRTLGFDTLWKQDYRDDELLRVSREEQRLLLTRDRELSERGDPAFTFYVQPTAPQAQIIEVVRHFGLAEAASEGKGFLTRCLDCNHPLLPVQPHQVADRLPGSIRLEFDEFFLCTRCERVFWKGSHFDRMRSWMERVLREAAPDLT